MKPILWSPEKALVLRTDPKRQGVGFEECLIAIAEGRVLADLPHPNLKFSHQRMYILNINNYAFVVPYVVNKDGIFLKTVFPSRKHTAMYLRD